MPEFITVPARADVAPALAALFADAPQDARPGIAEAIARVADRITGGDPQEHHWVDEYLDVAITVADTVEQEPATPTATAAVVHVGIFETVGELREALVNLADLPDDAPVYVYDPSDETGMQVAVSVETWSDGRRSLILEQRVG